MLRYVTITGADDHTDPQDLLALSARFPFVEWAFLRSAKPPRARYPSMGWLKNMATVFATKHEQPTPNTALHLCGQLARGFVDDYRDSPTPIELHDLGCQRMQINGYVPIGDRPLWGREDLPVLAAHVEIILQCRSEDSLLATREDAEELQRHGDKASVLYDPSGGRGRSPTAWPQQLYGGSVGYAGGIGPENVVEVLEDLGARESFWIDMETKVRNDADQLDLQKVEAVLLACQPFSEGLRSSPEYQEWVRRTRQKEADAARRFVAKVRGT
jgi:hypothetical protein